MENEEKILNEVRFANRKKSLVVAFILTLLFGPIGVLYGNVKVGIINGMFIILLLTWVALSQTNILVTLIGIPTIIGASYAWSIVLALICTDEYNGNLARDLGVKKQH